MALPFHSEDYMDGAEAAAVIAAGVGVLAVGAVVPVGAWLMALHWMPCAWVRPALTALAFAIWLGTWWRLRRAWQGRAYAARRVLYWSGGLLLLGWVIGSPLLVWLFPGLKLP